MIKFSTFVHNKFMGVSKILNEKKKEKFAKKHKVGLCLSGGGARGFAYLGAFRAFEEHGIEFDFVAGSSVGSLFGLLYSTGISYEEMYNLTSFVKNSDFRNNKFGFLPSKMDNLSEFISSLLPIKKLEELKRTLFVVAVDLKSGKEIHFSSGEIAPIVTGSCAIPAVFLPVKYKNMMLIDGGVTNNIPTDVLRENGCDFVVTIDCNPTRGKGTASKNFFTQLSTVMGIMMTKNSKNGIIDSDILIQPNMKRFASLKIVDKQAMIEEGYKATIQMMPEIERLFTGKFKRKG